MRFLLFLTAFVFVNATARAQTGVTQIIQMLVPGFKVEELPIKLSNQNNLRFSPDGTLTSLGYDGKIWQLRDTNGDGLEDTAEPYWNKPTLSVPLGMAWSTQGLLVSSKGKISLLRDTDGNGIADVEDILVSGWPRTDVGSGGVDATAVTLDGEGNIYFGLLVADYSNAYRLRKRKDLKLDEIAWLKERNRWREPSWDNSGDDEFSLYDINSRRGTIQKWSPRAKQLSTIATGIRVPVALAFNRSGDLFNTDQEGETWMPNGNPLDELNHIVEGRNYGFPPRHDRWLPNIVSEEPVASFGPQHQSSCGLVFNEPHPATPLKQRHDTNSLLPAAPVQALFGPKDWEGNAFVAGESRAKIWRVRLAKTPGGYVGKIQTLARVSMLTMDVAISPRGELYVCCHSGKPDWGTGPQGQGKIFKITYSNNEAPLPLATWPASATEVRVTFQKQLDPSITKFVLTNSSIIEFGDYVSAGDRFEVLKPPYAVVQQQDATPRGRLGLQAARLEDEGRTIVLTTQPHIFATRYAITLHGIRSKGDTGTGHTIDLDYDMTQSSQPVPSDLAGISPKTWQQTLDWAPTAHASAGTDSRAPRKPGGDWEHGRQLFFGTQLQCAKCHRIRGEGGLTGPDLSNLIHRDATSVLRDIREPSATLHPDYVTYQVATKDGDTIQGFVRSQKADSLQLFDVDGKETVIDRANIESVRPTELSLMPAGLLDGKKETDVRDLLTYLLWEPPNRTKEAAAKLLTNLKATTNNTAPIRELRLVLVASKQDHGPGQHDYPTWQTNWSRLLNSPATKCVAEKAWEWPTPEQFNSASVIVFYCWNHNWSAERLAELDSYLAKGGGLVMIHSAVIADKDPETLAARIGLSAQPRRSGFRHMPFELKFVGGDHPITHGFPGRVDLLDEPYWPLIGATNDVTVLASAEIEGGAQPLIWTRQKGNGRIFVSIPGHYTWTLDDLFFRVVLLRGIAWAAGENPERLQDVH